MSYVYVLSEKWTDDDGVVHYLYTAGFYKPDGRFEPESDWLTKECAASRVNFLNGGNDVRWKEQV